MSGIYSNPHPPPGPSHDDTLVTDLDDSDTSPPGTSKSEDVGQIDLGDNLTDESVSVKEAFAALSKKHEESLKENEKLITLLDAERLRTTQLENQLALG